MSLLKNIVCWWKTGELCADGVMPDAAPIESVDTWFPEDQVPGGGAAPSYPNAPSQVYSDQYRVLFPNPISVGTSVLQIALANRTRKEMILVNVGTATIYVGFGFNPTPTNYSIFLQPCSAANDGTGGIMIDEAWKGTVFVLAAGASGGLVNFTEIPA
jgi:hypothetical protein